MLSSPSPDGVTHTYHMIKEVVVIPEGNLPHYNTKHTHLSKKKYIYSLYSVPGLAPEKTDELKALLQVQLIMKWKKSISHIPPLLLDFLFLLSRHDSLKAEVFNNSKVFQVSFFFFCRQKDTSDQSFALYYSISVQK